MSEIQVGQINSTDGSTAITTGADGYVSFAKTQIGGRRNIAYNGAMNIWQRGTSADTATSGDYTCDRWQIAHLGLDGNVDWDQETASTPDGFGYALKISTDASETSLDASDLLFVRQKFEGQDLQQLQKGTSGAKSLTVSFWAKSSVASTYTVELYDNDNTRSISKSYVINTADTWEFKTVTFEGDTTGALDSDNAFSLQAVFIIDAGSDYTSGTFSTAWQAYSATERVYDTTGWLESTTPTFYITGVQLEVGPLASPFEHRSYGEELALCQRYYTKVTVDSANDSFGVGLCDAAGNATGDVFFPVTMRVAPTALEQTGTASDYEIRKAGSTITCNVVPDYIRASQFQSTVSFNALGLTAGQAALIRAATTSAYLAWSAEL